MQAIWKRIEDWLSIHAPELLSLLQPGASEEDIQHTEALLNVIFPEEIKESYRIHNGSGGLFSDSHFFFEDLALFSLTEMVECWQMYRDIFPPNDYPDEPTDCPPELIEDPGAWREGLSPDQQVAVMREDYDFHLVPLLRRLDEVVLCFDTDPIHQTTGMIVQYDPQSGFSFYAWNWRDLLSSFADDLEAGKYRVEYWDEYSSLIKA